MTIFSDLDGSIVRAQEWFLVRDKTVPARNGLKGHTQGEIRYGVLDSQRICFTGEDEDKRLEDGNGRAEGAAIPCGRYRLTLPVNGRGININNVDGFRGVKICADCGGERLHGDVAVGDARTLDGCGACRVALVRLITELRRLTMQGVAVFLNVGRSE